MDTETTEASTQTMLDQEIVKDNEVLEELSPLNETSKGLDEDIQQRLPQYKYRSSHPRELMLIDPQSGM